MNAVEIDSYIATVTFNDGYNSISLMINVMEIEDIYTETLEIAATISAR